MLFNPTKLQGIAPKIQKLAVREMQISAKHEESLGRPQHSMVPPGPGPLQLDNLVNGTKSGTSSEEPSPVKRAPSLLPDIKEAPVVDIVPGVKHAQVLACAFQPCFAATAYLSSLCCRLSSHAPGWMIVPRCTCISI